MPRKAIAFVLVALLIAPLNAGAASWMALSMVESQAEHSQQADVAAETDLVSSNHEMHMAAHHHKMKEGLHDSQHGNHDAEDCEEHCLSCSNHCSSLGIVADQSQRFDLASHQSGLETNPTSSHSDLLLRPPISA